MTKPDPTKSASGSPGDSALNVGMQQVIVEVLRFLKHPAGHTVYECRVGILPTRQVWVVFKRYRDFVGLRQQLKDLCNQREPQPLLTAARSHPTRGSGSHTDRGVENAVHRGKRGEVESGALAKSIKVLLASKKFPSKLALGASLMLRLERRKALHGFMVELVRLRPLPEIVASFLGLLDDNRMMVDKDGGYVQVVRADKVVPMPTSPHNDKSTRTDWNDVTRDAATTSATKTTGIPSKDRGSSVTTRERNEGGLGSSIPPSTTNTLSGGKWRLQQPHSRRQTLQRQAIMGERAWQRVITLERRRPSGEEAMERGWSDTDEPTDIESGSESETDSVHETDDFGGKGPGEFRGRGVVVSWNQSGSSSLSPRARVRGGGGGGGIALHEREEEEERYGRGVDLAYSGRGESVEGEGGREETDVDEEQEARVTQSEFMNDYLTQVVAKVVGRKDLDQGMRGRVVGEGGAEEKGKANNPYACLPVDEQNMRMGELQSLGVDLSKEKLALLLRYNDWGPEAATALYQDLKAAGKGFLEKVTPGETLRGVENGGNTCYIDSLLFAMFATLDAFDWLLLKKLPARDPREVKVLQKHLRFWVNQLRRGAVIPREHSNLIRAHIIACGWHGGPSTQEDVSELFTFLVCLLRCPALPLSEALFHGGTNDVGDSRISTERALYLALPEEKETDRVMPSKSGSSSGVEGTLSAEGKPAKSSSSSPPSSSKPRDGPGAARRANAAGGAGVTLEQILIHNFHNNRVEGLERTVSGEKGNQRVDAWRMVSMLPFYALSGEYAGDTDPSNDKHFDKIMLPMVLKRYEAEMPSRSSEGATPPPKPTTTGVGGGGAKKSQRKVVVPHRLDCSKFMVPMGGKGGGDSVQYGRFVLVLRSAVCHLGGESVNRGHYIAYAGDQCPASEGQRPDEDLRRSKRNLERLSSEERALSIDSHDSVAWLRLDDMKKRTGGRGFVEKLESVHEANHVFSEHLGLHSYMLFYELVQLDLDDADVAQIKEKFALIETQGDYELALTLDMVEKSSAGSGKREGRSRDPSSLCPVS